MLVLGARDSHARTPNYLNLELYTQTTFRVMGKKKTHIHTDVIIEYTLIFSYDFR